MTGLRLIAAGHTRALRRAVFGGDDPLDDAGRNIARTLRIPGNGPWISAPSRAARETAALLGATPGIDPALADPRYGTWTGHTLDQIDPADLHTWLTDPAAAPHGGESHTQLLTRATTWLRSQHQPALTAVAHPTIIRAVLAAALDLPATAIRRLDVAPLAVTRLTRHPDGWHLHLPQSTS
ncbi:broad specificity phosphatase PhoE [Actinoplanes campanulatus]|uniref:Broad specificity phosphatase PhoE n=1 Tax=Actinoplanes campanulatus TaxID=113559 RepID=A0A7W5AM48_9ACTN|nr:histidine phosphatase family protein [Actinoplanes campanulatus]MBB3098572.1 broad specificity phosphatase PhoE [Actinoplanes campanulatus]GGN35950.1 phosphoglycerate mutase [Actinoplanes campanulatus]GID39266.1 phosphoglycerate mutase [Actinoplanes campanulatus]